MGSLTNILLNQLPRGKTSAAPKWKQGIGTQTKGKHLMKTKSKSMQRGRAFLLAICAGVVATFMVDSVR